MSVSLNYKFFYLHLKPGFGISPLSFPAYMNEGGGWGGTLDTSSSTEGQPPLLHTCLLLWQRRLPTLQTSLAFTNTKDLPGRRFSRVIHVAYIQES